MRVVVILVILVVSVKSYSQEKEIKEILSNQVDCWNKGDLDCFMHGYWKSDELVFVGSNGPKYGWQVTLNNYKKSYPSTDAMGELKFDLLKLSPLGKKNYLVIGKWSLKRKNDQPQGHFSLVFEKIGKEWKIIADHSS